MTAHRSPDSKSGDAAPRGGAFAAMAATYGLGVFNDNFFKQAAGLLAVLVARKPEYQGIAAALFSLPFVVFAAPAGWCADRFPKVRVVRASKALEVVAMACGAAGLWFLSWPLIMTMLFLMGAQSTLFSPALNGAIPETFPRERVVPVNGVLKMATTAMMLLGMAAAGWALGLGGEIGGIPAGRATAAGTVFGIAVLGLLAAGLLPPGRPAANPAAPFPWNGPRTTLRVLADCRRDPPLWRVMRRDAFLWGVAVAETLWINQLAAEALDLGAHGATLLMMAELLGVAAGGGLAGWRAKRNAAFRGLAVAAGVAAAGGAATVAFGAAAMYYGATPTLVGCTAASLFVLGFGGGRVLVPMEGYTQLRPPPERKGEVWAAANAMTFTAMMASGGVLALAPLVGVDAVAGFALVAVAFATLAYANARRPMTAAD